MRPMDSRLRSSIRQCLQQCLAIAEVRPNSSRSGRHGESVSFFEEVRYPSCAARARLGGAYLLNQAMRSVLFGIRHIDFTVLGGVALLLLLAALLACVAPAGRAASVEPMQALRTE